MDTLQDLEHQLERANRLLEDSHRDSDCWRREIARLQKEIEDARNAIKFQPGDVVFPRQAPSNKYAFLGSGRIFGLEGVYRGLYFTSDQWTVSSFDKYQFPSSA